MTMAVSFITPYAQRTRVHDTSGQTKTRRSRSLSYSSYTDPHLTHYFRSKLSFATRPAPPHPPKGPATTFSSTVYLGIHFPRLPSYSVYIFCKVLCSHTFLRSTCCGLSFATRPAPPHPTKNPADSHYFGHRYYIPRPYSIYALVLLQIHLFGSLKLISQHS